MDHLYILELNVAADDHDGRHTYSLVAEHIHKWLSQDQDPDEPALDLTRPGEAELPGWRAGEEFRRSAKWAVGQVGDIAYLKVSVRQPMEGTPNATFATEVLLLLRSDTVVFRIELGRQGAPGILSPAIVRTLRRPRLIGQILRDWRLRCTTHGEEVTGRFTGADSTNVAKLISSIGESNRLPMLLIDGRTKVTRGFAHKVAPEVAGLAQVALLDAGAGASLAELRDGGLDVPEYGARLIWPDLHARHPAFSESDLRRWDGTTQTLLRILGNVSVSARGQNRWDREIAAAERQRREARFRQDLDTAVKRGDSAAQVATLKQQIARLDDENQQAWNLANQYSDEVDELKAKLHALQLKADNYEQSLSLRPSESDDANEWRDAPELEDDDLQPLSDFLTDMSDGALVFTANAGRSWRQSSYPLSDRIRGHLVVLAQAAVAWRDADCQTGGLMDDWFREKWNLSMADSDKGLVHAKKDKFDFEGIQYSRVPHLKLDDHTSPSEVGRIYFAHDAKTKRFIVDHVGLKLYGV